MTDQQSPIMQYTFRGASSITISYDPCAKDRTQQLQTVGTNNVLMMVLVHRVKIA